VDILRTICGLPGIISDHGPTQIGRGPSLDAPALRASGAEFAERPLPPDDALKGESWRVDQRLLALKTLYSLAFIVLATLALIGSFEPAVYPVGTRGDQRR